MCWMNEAARNMDNVKWDFGLILGSILRYCVYQIVTWTIAWAVTVNGSIRIVICLNSVMNNSLVIPPGALNWMQKRISWMFTDALHLHEKGFFELNSLFKRDMRTTSAKGLNPVFTDNDNEIEDEIFFSH